MAAADPGNDAVVEQLLENGFNADSKDVLQRAAWNGHLRVVQLLLDFGANVNSLDLNKKSALVCACERERLEIVEELLRRGADPNLKGTDHPLIAGRGKEEIIQLLLQFGSDPNAKDVITRYGWDGCLEPIKLLLAYGCNVDALDYNKKSPLVCACERERVEIVKVLLEHRANPNLAATEVPLMAGRANEDVVKLLLQYGVSPSTKDVATRMAWDGNFDSLKVLIEAGCPVDILDLNKVTPLHAAAQRDRTELTRYLLGEGADPNLLAPDSCLMAARGNPDSVKHLLDFGADPNTKDVLTHAAWDGCLDTVAHMLDAGADINIKDLNKVTPLHAACQRERPELVKLLLERGADANLPGPETPLKASRRNGEITKLLISFGANPFDPDLLAATAWDEGLDSVSHLLDAGADVNARDYDKHTALWAAVERNYEAIIMLLMDRGADPNLIVVLPKAAWHGNLNVVRRLVDGGAWINAKNERDQTALQLAAAGGKSEVLQFLLDRGASQ
jgi:ankyrin repeat protein